MLVMAAGKTRQPFLLSAPLFFPFEVTACQECRQDERRQSGQARIISNHVSDERSQQLACRSWVPPFAQSTGAGTKQRGLGYPKVFKDGHNRWQAHDVHPAARSHPPTTIAVEIHFPYRFCIDAACSAERIGRTGLPDKLEQSRLGRAVCH
jgi:hypothetical protein